MTYQLVCLALLRSNLHLFRLEVTKVRVLYSLEWFGNIFDTLYLKEKRLCQVYSTVKRCVKTSRAKQKLQGIIFVQT